MLFLARRLLPAPGGCRAERGAGALRSAYDIVRPAPAAL